MMAWPVPSGRGSYGNAIVPGGPVLVHPRAVRKRIVSDAKDYSLDGDDREEWDRSWRAMPHRRLTSPPKAGVGSGLAKQFGEPNAFTISQDPPQFADRPWRESDCCPICGDATTGSERLPATLNLRWADGLMVGCGVWAHGACFDNCPDTGEPTPVPW